MVARGPCNLPVLRQCWVHGVIDENTLVWGQGLMDWLPAKNIRTLVPMIRTVEGEQPSLILFSVHSCSDIIVLVDLSQVSMLLYEIVLPRGQVRCTSAWLKHPGCCWQYKWPPGSKGHSH